MANKYAGLAHLQQVLEAAKANFVAKEAGKGLSTNDYTTEEKNKLAGLSPLAPATTNDLGGIKVGNDFVSTDAGVLSIKNKGSANGVATLDANGKLPLDQLPPAADDVVYGYYDTTTHKFYREDTFITEIIPVSDKYYIDLDTLYGYIYVNNQYATISSMQELTAAEVTAMVADVFNDND